MPNDRIKIVYILATNRGGMLHYLAQLANAVSKYADVIVIGPKEFPYRYFYCDIDIRAVIDCPVGTKMHKGLSFKNINLINEINPDVIHTTMAHHPLIAFFLYILRIDKKYPIIYTYHDPQPHVDRKPVEVIGNLLYAYLIKFDKIIVHGKALREVLIGKGISDEKIAVIPHGDYSFFVNCKKTIHAAENCILFFGCIRAYKGLEYLIKAVPLISKEIQDFKVIIAGEGDFSKYSKLITDKSKFEIHNKFIPDEMVSELFQRAELLILPYIEATQSGPLHIAYAFKKPVVATNVGAIPEVVEDGKTGHIVPPRDVTALADAIIKLLKDDELRKEMGESAYNKMREELSWDRIAEMTIEVYKEVIQNKKCE